MKKEVKVAIIGEIIDGGNHIHAGGNITIQGEKQ